MADLHPGGDVERDPFGLPSSIRLGFYARSIVLESTRGRRAGWCRVMGRSAAG